MAFPQTELGVIVQLYYSGKWNTITSYVRVSNGITITRGRADEASTPAPTKCTLVLDNSDGRFTANNPRAALYGLIGRNTLIRVRVWEDPLITTRFYGYVSAWPTKWDVSGKDVYVPIEAYGVRHLIMAGNRPVQSAMRRGLSESSSLAAYWPMEDGKLATSFASPMEGVSPLAITNGTCEPAAYSDVFGSDSLPYIKTAKLTGFVPSYADGAGQFRMMMRIPASTVASDTTLVNIHTTGTVKWWRIYYMQEGEGCIGIAAYNAAGNSVLDLYTDLAVDDKNIRLTVNLDQNGTGIDWLVGSYQQFASFATYMNDTLASQTLGRIRAVVVNPANNLGDAVVGHITVEPIATDIFNQLAAVNAHNNETVNERLDRLCDENGITYSGTSTGTERLGPQGIASVDELIQEAVKLEGYLREDRAGTSLIYRSNQDMYNQAPVATLDYNESGHILPDLEPIDDDQVLTNDVTVTRRYGIKERVTLDTGALSTQNPPDGVGIINSDTELSLSTDAQAVQQAGWRLHIGTSGNQRYTSISYDMATLPTLMSTLYALDVSWPIALDNLPAWCPEVAAVQIVQGYTEVLKPFEWSFDLNTTPARDFEVFEIEDTDNGRLDTAGSTLAANIDADDTSISVASAGARWIDSATYAAQFPFTARIEGEPVVVTAISGTSSPQTFTVTRATDGSARAHSSGAAIQLHPPVVWAL